MKKKDQTTGKVSLQWKLTAKFQKAIEIKKEMHICRNLLMRLLLSIKS